MQTVYRNLGDPCPKCGGLYLLTKDNRFNVDFRPVQFFKCINCGKQEFLLQFQRVTLKDNLRMWANLATPKEVKHTNKKRMQSLGMMPITVTTHNHKRRRLALS